MKGKISLIAVALFITMIAAIVVTRRDFTQRNYRIFPGMVYQPAYQPQSENPVLRQGKTLQASVAGTIPRGYNPYRYPNSPDGRQNSGWDLRNPYEDTPAVLSRGQEVFENFCSHCHGLEGRGDGPVAQRSLLKMSLLDTITRDRSDGGIFHIITYGRLYMPAHGGQIGQEDRWKLIRYLRQLQDRSPQEF